MTSSFEKKAEIAWKWLLRLAGLGAFLYVLIFKAGDVPLGVFVLIGGLIGLPNVISLQQMLNKASE